MCKLYRKFISHGLVLSLMLSGSPGVVAYEVAVGLGSTADQSISVALGDGTQWPYVAEMSWGPLANHYPVGLLTRSPARSHLR